MNLFTVPYSWNIPLYESFHSAILTEHLPL